MEQFQHSTQGIRRAVRSGGALFVGTSAILLLLMALPSSASHIPVASSLPDSCREVEPSAEVPQVVEIGEVVFDIANWALGRGNENEVVGFTTSPMAGLGDGQRVDFAFAGSLTETVEGTLDAAGGFVSSAPNSISTVVFCLIGSSEPSSETSATSGPDESSNSEEAAATESVEEAQSEVLDESLATTGPTSDRLHFLAYSLVMAGAGLLLLNRWPERGRHASPGNSTRL